MRMELRRIGLFAVTGLLVAGVGIRPALAKSIYGKVTEVRSGEIVILDHGKGTYNVRLAGVQVATEGPAVAEATRFVSDMARGKDVRVWFDHRTPDGEMVGRLLLLGTPEKDVGLELVKAGLAHQVPSNAYKDGELVAAEAEAKKAKRGLWK